MMAKTNTGLVAYCKAQLGMPYWYGSFGQFGTLAFYNQKKKQYPGQYKWAYDPAHTMRKVHDCVGLIKGYLWCDAVNDGTPTYNASQDKSADGMYNTATVKGPISTLPEVPGVLVHKGGHIGVYIGGGKVIEARGHAYGVVMTNLKDRGWEDWCECPYITYEKKDKTVDLLSRLIKKVEALPEYKELSKLMEE